MDHFFENVARETIQVGSASVELPILYRDASQFGVFFTTDLAAARALLKDAPVEPWPVFGRAMAAIYVWEYCDTSVGSYNELGIGVQARRRGGRPSLLKLGLDMEAQDDQGIWVVNLPVTTQAAYDAGVEIWGYPKYVTSITTRFEKDAAICRLGDELGLAIGRPGGPRTRLPIVTYTKHPKGHLVRTVIATDHLVQWGSASGARLELLGDGPTAKTVRLLGLHERTPVLTFRTDSFRAKLPAGATLRA
jgi:Acetoacetate decarboxylase (ADC)